MKFLFDFDVFSRKKLAFFYFYRNNYIENYSSSSLIFTQTHTKLKHLIFFGAIIKKYASLLLLFDF